MGFNDFYRLQQRFIEHSIGLKGNAQGTIKSMSVGFNQYRNFSGIEFFSQFTRQSVEDWIIQGKLHRNWSPKTIRIYLCYFSLFADWCVKQGELKYNFIKEIDRPRQPRKLPRALNEQQSERLLDWVKGFPFGYRYEKKRAIAIIATFMATGIRRSELLNLKMDDVDLVRQELYVRAGKGGKDRKIPFRYSLTRILEDYLCERKRLKKTCPHFFASLKFDARMGEKALYRLVTRLRDKSGIHFTPHMLRHTYATRMLESGLHIREVQELMGHADMKTTAIYLSVTGERLKEQVLAKGFDV